MRGSYTKIIFFKKIVCDKTVFIVMIDLFCSPHSICLNFDFGRVLFYGNVLSVVVLLTKKRYSRFSRRVLVFYKICVKVQAFRIFKIYSQ